jgi:hypothetical protein
MRLRPPLLLPLLLAALVATALALPVGRAEPASAACTPQPTSPAYNARVERALRSGQDVWGNQLIASPRGPTYEAASRRLTPLVLAYGRARKPLTDSGVHYVPFGQPPGPQGSSAIALHVADGSQIVAERAGGRRLSVLVGARGDERYGSCLQRLATPRLVEGYLPVLETNYVDASGAHYRQESFAVRLPETRSLVSFVQLTVDTRGATAASTRVRLRPSESGLSAAGNRLRRGGATHLVFGEGGTFDGSGVTYTFGRGQSGTVYAVWLNYPGASGDLTADGATFERARAALVDYWADRLTEGMTLELPDRRVLDAARALVIQNLTLTWRYSMGNPYEQFSFPEGVDVSQVMGELGFGPVSRQIMRTSLTRKETPYPNWKMGEKLLGSARYYRLFRDRGYIASVTPTLRRYVGTLGRQIEASPTGLLGRERYSSDIPDQVLGLHSQAVVWQGLSWMGQVWSETGNGPLARRCRTLATRLAGGLRRAVAASQRRLPDGSLFIPVRLLDDEAPYDSLTQSRAGSYWNLVAPYAFASGFFRPDSPQANGVLRYMLRHGSRLMGVVRAGAYALYPDPVFPTSGTDQVYGINVARFLADNDEPDQLVLSLYGSLGAAMAPGTFVSGEGATVAPLGGRYQRSMYLPPNGASNAAFLETLRVMLVNETTTASGAPEGLELAFATPRPWLAPGRRIAVRNAPTSFGPLSYVLEAAARSIDATIEVPERRVPRRLALRVRLPRGARITTVLVDGSPYGRVDRATQTIDLSGQRGPVMVQVGYAR